MDSLMHLNAAPARPASAETEDSDKGVREPMDDTLPGGTLSGLPVRPEGLQFRLFFTKLGPPQEVASKAEEGPAR
jgi:hypothetical protein